MRVGREETNYGPREHPWTTANHDARGLYYDFKANPKLIREVIEDLKPYEQYESTLLFYRILEDINGPSSELESNDLIFRGPSANKTVAVAKQLQCVGRLCLLFRELHGNCSAENMNWFVNRAFGFLQNETPAFAWGAVAISAWDTLFTAIQQEGQIVVFRYWAWGNTEDETMGNLSAVLRNIGNCALVISSEARSQISKGDS